MRIANPLYELASSILHPLQYRWNQGRLLYLSEYRRWQRAVRASPRLTVPGPERLTIILLSYKRMRNMAPIVESLLLADFVERIVVSNNNPGVRIADWIGIRDERLRLLDQPVKTPPGIRFQLAQEDAGEYFLSIDDDVFLTPEQVRRLFLGMIARPGTAHGILGENYRGPHKVGFPQYWEVDQRGFGGQVDTLNTVYGFSRRLLPEMERLAGGLGLDLSCLENGEDLLLSNSGDGRPYIHDVGPVTICLSAHRIGVATWASRKRFFTDRKELFLKLRSLRPDLGPPEEVGP